MEKITQMFYNIISKFIFVCLFFNFSRQLTWASWTSHTYLLDFIHYFSLLNFKLHITLKNSTKTFEKIRTSIPLNEEI